MILETITLTYYINKNLIDIIKIIHNNLNFCRIYGKRYKNNQIIYMYYIHINSEQIKNYLNFEMCAITLVTNQTILLKKFLDKIIIVFF